MYTRILVIVVALTIGLGLVFVSLAMAGSPVNQAPEEAETAVEIAKALAAEQVTAPHHSNIQALKAGSSGPLFVGVDNITVDAYTIDVTDNSFFPAFNGVQVWGAAYDPDGKRVFFISGTELWQWSVGGTPSLLGTVMIEGAAASMVGLAYYNNTLYASRNIGTEDIYAIDTTTLAATVALALTPPTTDRDLGGIDMDPVTGQLYGTNDAEALRGLVQIDPDGSMTVIAPYPNGETDIDGLAISDSNAYLVTDDPGFIYVYNFDVMTYTEPLNNPWTTSELFSAGAWIASSERVAYCKQPASPIPDNFPSGLTSELVINDNGNILDLDIRLDVSHTWVGDLIFTLEHLGTTITFIDRPGVPGTTFGCSANNLIATINDEGLGAVENTCLTSGTGIAGNLVGGDPVNNSLLTAFDGRDLSGTWRLTVSDNASPDAGTLNEWCLVATIDSPEIAVAPNSLFSMQPANVEITQTLTISNVGGGDLQWVIGQLPPTVVLNNSSLPQFEIAPHENQAAEPVVTSPDQCELYENYLGAEPSGYAEYCLGLNLQQETVNAASTFGVMGRGFAHDIGPISDNVVEFSLDSFSDQIIRSNNNQLIYAYDYDSTGTILYALNNSEQQLGTFDLATGTFTAIGSTVPEPGHTWTGLAIHPVEDTIYASSAGAPTSVLYTLDAATGAATQVGDITGLNLIIALAMNVDGELYAHDIGMDSIYQIDPATGEPTLIGPTGYNASFAQGMDFDNNDGSLYIFLYTGGGTNVFGTVDLSTGAVTPLAQDDPLGEFEGAIGTQLPCSGDIPWASTSPITGTISGGSATEVTILFDSTGLPQGVHTGVLCIDSSDISSPRITLPITLTVNVGPLAVNDVFTTIKGETLNVPAPGVLANDSDADGDPLEAVLVTPTSHGSLTLNPDGSFTYTPDIGFEGQDTFTYYANDGFADSNIVTVTIRVESGLIYIPIVVRN